MQRPLVQLLLAACLTGAYSLSIESLVAKANIYNQKDLVLGDVADWSATESLKVIVHGFTGSRTHISIKSLLDAYRVKEYENVFVADWEDAAGLAYPTSRYAIGKVAQHFGEILNEFLNKFGIDRAAVHLIGHSLGAHIVGGMGAFFNGTLGRITGLDPALPLFTPLSSDGLYAAAARFVDVIHTDFPFFGDITPRGTADFYPHFGRAPQRGCDDISLIAASRLVFEAYSCSHNRAVGFYAETVLEPTVYPATPCAWNYIHARNITACSAASPAATVYMGEGVTSAATGSYYLN